jgi:hypothetical protein
VNALLKHGTRITVLKGLTDREQARFIKEIVEKRLGIVDTPMAGESAT